MVEQLSEKSVENWLRIYEEELRYARHHETLRFYSTNVIVTISAAVLGFLSSNNGVPNQQQVMLGCVVITVNIYGCIMSLKHYERSRRHTRIAGKLRNTISKIIDGANGSIRAIREQAIREHTDQMRTKCLLKSTLNIRAYILWCFLHIVLVAMGILTVIPWQYPC